MTELQNKNLKVAGGKLLKAAFSVENDQLQNVKITGDFFMYPEEKITGLETSLNGISFEKEAIQTAVSSFFTENSVDFIGGTAEDFANLFTQEVPAQ